MKFLTTRSVETRSFNAGQSFRRWAGNCVVLNRNDNYLFTRQRKLKEMPQYQEAAAQRDYQDWDAQMTGGKISCIPEWGLSMRCHGSKTHCSPLSTQIACAFRGANTLEPAFLLLTFITTQVILPLAPNDRARTRRTCS